MEQKPSQISDQENTHVAKSIDDILEQIEEDANRSTMSLEKDDSSETNSLNRSSTPEKNEQKKEKKEKKKTEVEILKDKIIELESTIKKMDLTLTEQKSKYAYLQAEMENTRKHYIKQQDIIKNKTIGDTIISFTPLIDSFEKALTTKDSLGEGQENCQTESFVKGFEALYEKLQKIFKDYKVEPIEKTGIPFNYKIHEVMMKTINDDLAEDTVINIFQKGYKINGEVIRPAKVVVTKKTPPPILKEDSKIEETKNSEENHE